MAYVTVRPDDEVIHVADAETILGGLAKAGFTYRVGCRRGGCGICKVTLVEGQVTYERPIASAVLTDEERADGTCLSCRAVPDGDVTIELRDDTLRLTNPLLRMLNKRQVH